MTTRDPPPSQIDQTPQGAQLLVPGVRPITTRDRLDLLVAAPMRLRTAQKPLDIGLFNEAARNQIHLF